jgi:acetolactate synthase-1/2/3 large subunit
MNVAEQTADFLAAKGCTHAFGIVGGANLTLFEALARKLEVISVHQEQAAALASLYHYRACGRIAPCLVTAGGGSANAITGVIEAQMDGIPLLVISGNELTRWFAPPRTRTVGFQGFDPCEVVHSFTKRCVSVDNALGARMALDGLYRVALEHRQGACWLDVPQDIAGRQAE